MIYTGLNNTSEVEAVYAAKKVTTTGTPPLSYSSKGYNLEDFLISGNTVQDGTPTPETPVEVIGCGARTENLFDGNYVNAYVTAEGIYRYPDTTTKSIIVKCDTNTTYTIKQITGINAAHKWRIAVFNSMPTDNAQGTILVNDNSLSESIITTANDSAYIVVYYVYTSSPQNVRFMINEGSIALPYEPYGFKLPIALNGTEYPFYLGEVQTARRIKKLVLTGNETFVKNDPEKPNNYLYYKTGYGANEYCFCTHVVNMGVISTTKVGVFNDNRVLYLNFGAEIMNAQPSGNTAAGLKEYLAEQYTRGTPVTVWYVLSKPETGIVNEPLHKIGNYADTISLSQSGITVPTIAGTNIITTETTVLPSNISVTTPEKEVEEIYAGINYQNPIYYKSRTIIGQIPLSYKALSKPLADYLISGNTTQDGTPTPDAPVDVVGCGVRTGNLVATTARIQNINISPLGRLEDDYADNYDVGYFHVIQGDTYIVDAYVYAFYYDIPAVGSTSYNRARVVGEVGSPSSFTAPITGYCCFRVNSGDRLMANIGSTALPYEPYGYKLPLTVNGTKSPIYLGEVQTARRIKKLVLTGNEKWVYRAGNPPNTFFIEFVGARFINNLGLCTHYPNQDSGSFDVLEDKHILIRFSEFGVKSYIGLRESSITSITFDGVSELKAYLAAKYAAGTPVTVWYVLAEQETSIVNEPLMKIGDYADTITMAQAGVTIPTVSGTNVLDMTSAVKPSAVSITGNIKSVI